MRSRTVALAVGPMALDAMRVVDRLPRDPTAGGEPPRCASMRVPHPVAARIPKVTSAIARTLDALIMFIRLLLWCRRDLNGRGGIVIIARISGFTDRANCVFIANARVPWLMWR